MPDNITKGDLRHKKTGKALDVAMLSLLKTRNFRKITVKDICNTALISRAAFYSRFNDKYDMLKDWLIFLWPKDIDNDDPYEKIEITVNQFVRKNEAVIKNIVYDADGETLDILFDSILDALDLPVETSDNKNSNPKYVVLSNFYAGGMMRYIMWQVKNNFPPDVAPMNIYFYEVIEKFQEWKAVN